MSVAELHREEIIPYVVQYMDRNGDKMLFVGDDVFAVEIAAVRANTITFVASDLFGEEVAVAKFSLHLFEALTSPLAILDYLNESVHDALVDSVKRGGQTVIVAR